MLKIINSKVYLNKDNFYTYEDMQKNGKANLIEKAYERTISNKILSAHNLAKGREKLQLKFDALASHDITYVGIVQTAKGSGLTEFPLPYILTNCHNSLCAVGGTINEDDHLFGLSAAKKYGGIYVPPHLAVIHTYMREMFAGCGKMILGSDSHTRYGALGTMAIGEGGPELVKQLLNKTYDTIYPDTIAVLLTGNVRLGVGPQDVALALIGEVFKCGFVKNKVLEFVGSGITNLPIEFRNGIDVMTTETSCLSSIWCTDDRAKEYLAARGRVGEYKELSPEPFAEYDGIIVVDLDKIEPMIALPFHPSNVYKLSELIKNPYDILHTCEKEGQKLFGSRATFRMTDKIIDGKIYAGQGIIAGCAGGTYDNICEAAEILKGGSVGNGKFTLSVYPSSQPIYLELVKNGRLASLIETGAIIKTAFCGPCFGAGDVPANNELSIRHTTRNFESREGSRPADGQVASVALMDSRSIAISARNGGVLTSALDIDYDNSVPEFKFDGSIYDKKVYNGYKASIGGELRYGPNIADWPVMPALSNDIVMEVTAAIYDPITTTDELIPSGETSSYRSNPLKLASFALNRKAPDYVGLATAVNEAEKSRREGNLPQKYSEIYHLLGASTSATLCSVIYAVKPGDGSAREQAASVQRVLGGGANIASEYATKRYRSNLINWGMIPFISQDKFIKGDIIYIPNISYGIINGNSEFDAKVLRDSEVINIKLYLDAITDEEKNIILAGSLMGYYRN